MAPVGVRPSVWARAPAPAPAQRASSHTSGSVPPGVARAAPQTGHSIHLQHLPYRVPSSRRRKRAVAIASFDDTAPAVTEPKPKLTVHYYRHAGDAATFGLHVWGTRVAHATSWDAPVGAAVPELPPGAAVSTEPTWVSFEVPLLDPSSDAFVAKTGDPSLSFIVHRGDEQCAKVENFLGDADHGDRAVWIVAGNPAVFSEPPDLSKLPTGETDLGKARAIWVSEGCFALPFSVDPSKVFVELVASSDGGLVITDNGAGGVVCENGGSDVRYIPLEIDSANWSSPDAGEAGDKYPHVRAAGYAIARLPAAYLEQNYAPWLLKCQLAVQAKDVTPDGRHGRLREATSVQTHGAVDDVFGGYAGPLGVEIKKPKNFGGFGDAESSVTIRLWAPTARDVSLRVFRGPDWGDHEFEVPMNETADGVWVVEGPAEWEGKYYQYVVDVFHPWGGGAAGSFVQSVASDPYARSLSADGQRVHICDLGNQNLKPAGWDDTARWKKTTNQSSEPTDYAIYELHVRDFSAMDESTPSDLRGKYLAFAEQGTVPTEHLKALAKSGLTHVHLLPSYDFGSVPERSEHQKTVDHAWLSSLPSNSPDQQAAVASIANDDAFNWGYDPVHYGVPEGSYATNPDGDARVLEFRTMVQGLAGLGLRTIVDVVYNHTLSAGPTDRNSVLDKVVPGYYHRRNFDGHYENSTCCNNTASENLMMERLIVDDLVHWAVSYKVDGFRFDLMGHLMLRTVVKARDAIKSLTVKRNGVDGSKIYLYGEGWDYAEVSGGRVGTNASQLNLGGTGIGSFNDRLREGVMGGSPFGDPRVQGVMTGLYFHPNNFMEQGGAEAQLKRVIEDSEKVIAAMAGNLREFEFTNKDGYPTPSRDACWVGSNVGYAAQPKETVNYVSAHDNETLFDGIMLRSAVDVPLDVRCRINRLAVATVAFSQGVPFFHAGDEILRSKSLDRDSYNSGDWFNRLDYTGNSHNFGCGLPGREKNGDRYGFIGDLLGDLTMKPDRSMIQKSTQHFKEVLEIRNSTPLFRLVDAADVQRRITFYNTGPSQTPGVIVMGISDDAVDGVTKQICGKFNRLLVCLNVSPHEVTITDPNLATDLATAEMIPHPTQGTMYLDDYLLGAKCTGGGVVVPGHTACVFVEPRA